MEMIANQNVIMIKQYTCLTRAILTCCADYIDAYAHTFAKNFNYKLGKL